MRLPFWAWNWRKSQSANSGLTVCRKSILQASRISGSLGFGALSKGRNYAALCLPLRWQRIDAKPFCGEASGLIALDDQLDDVRGQECQVNHLHDPPLG